METKVKLNYMGKLLQASCKTGEGFWTFTTDDNEIIVESSNLPVAPPAGQRPVEIRPARYKRHLQSIVIIRRQCWIDIHKDISDGEELVRAKQQLNFKDAATIAAACKFIKTLKRDSAGNIMAKSGEASIKRFVKNFQHEAVFQDGRAVLVMVAETAVESAQNTPPTVNETILFHVWQEIVEHLDRGKRTPLPSQFFLHYCKDRFTMKKMERVYKWAYRTLKARKLELKKYLAQHFNGLTLEAFFVDRAIFSAAERQIKAARIQNAEYVNRRDLGDFGTDR